jgi:two-component system, NtrC family, nitrogen regulation sensor histidine kinase GlnL
MDTSAQPVERDILNGMPQPVLCLDEHDIICFANMTSEIFFNQSRAQIIGRALTVFVQHDSPLIALVREVRLAQSSFSELSVDLSLPGMPGQLVDIQVSPMQDQPGYIIVTLQSRTIARLINRQASHQSAARSVVGVSAMLAHEIKNPLSGIRGAAQLLENPDDPASTELTQLICTEVDRIRTLVDRMEIFTDTRPLDRKPENIHAVLGHVKQLAENGFARTIQFKERYDPSLPPVFANRDRLVQLFLNLIKNAAEAIALLQTGEILITTAYRHGVRVAVRGSVKRISLPIEICIIDNGPGAHEELVDHLFDPFITSKPGGSGLGLALAAQIVSDHGGVIEFDRHQNPARTILRVLLPMHVETNT